MGWKPVLMALREHAVDAACGVGGVEDVDGRRDDQGMTLAEVLLVPSVAVSTMGIGACKRGGSGQGKGARGAGAGLCELRGGSSWQAGCGRP